MAISGGTCSTLTSEHFLEDREQFSIVILESPLLTGFQGGKPASRKQDRIAHIRDRRCEFVRIVGIANHWVSRRQQFGSTVEMRGKNGEPTGKGFERN